MEPTSETTGESDATVLPAFILGAGFSRAIHSAMPVMGELGASVLDALQLDEAVLAEFGGNLERWMSFLSVEQPWLADGENLRNRGLFLDAAEAVNDVIQEAEQQVIRRPPPVWLTRLVWTWSETNANVFTFNYDTLVERCLIRMLRVSTLGDVYGASLVERMAVGSTSMLGSEGPRGPVFRLFKMHGSTNWGFGGLNGPASDPIVLLDSRPWWGPLAFSGQKAEPRWETRFDDLYPLIVPPTFSKGPYYNNSRLKGQWRRGAEALRNTSELSVMGYSFPPGDLTTREWVGTSLSPAAGMRVVDWSADVASRIRGELALGRDFEDETGDGAIERYVDEHCGDHLEWEIEEENNDPPARISLKINGVEQLGQHVGDRVWEPGLEQARRWLHGRIEDAAPSIIDGSLNQAVEGLVRERREVVLPLGATVLL